MAARHWVYSGIITLVLGVGLTTCKPCNDITRKLTHVNVPYLIKGEEQVVHNPLHNPLPNSPDLKSVPDFVPDSPNSKNTEKVEDSEPAEEPEEDSSKKNKSKGGSSIASPRSRRRVDRDNKSANKTPFVMVHHVGKMDVYKYALGLVRNGQVPSFYSRRFNRWDGAETEDDYKPVSPKDIYNNRMCKKHRTFMKGMHAYVCAIPNKSDDTSDLDRDVALASSSPVPERYTMPVQNENDNTLEDKAEEAEPETSSLPPRLSVITKDFCIQDILAVQYRAAILTEFNDFNASYGNNIKGKISIVYSIDMSGIVHVSGYNVSSLGARGNIEGFAKHLVGKLNGLEIRSAEYTEDCAVEYNFE